MTNDNPNIKKEPDFRSIWTNPIHFIACGFGIGTIPFAPGTFGTLLGVLVYIILQPLPLISYIVIVAALNIFGIWLCGVANRDFGTDDHPAAVWDEVAAFPIVMIGMPFAWQWILLGFLLFRFFDIIKPGPIGWIDKNVHGGFGVILDDVIAALASLGVLWLIIWLI